jgi:predicted permease
MIFLLQSVRVGVRGLRRSPGFAIMAIATLGLGIGISSAVLTVAEVLLLRPLPVRDQGSLVALWGKHEDRGFDNYPLGLESARAFASQTRTLDGVAFFGYEGASPAPVREGDRISRLNRSMVSGNFFDVLGAAAILGRTLTPDDDLPGAAPVLMISEGVWQRRFGADTAVIGRRLYLHDVGADYTIVGVVPRGLDFPRGSDLWAPVVASTPEANRQYIALNLVGRLAPGRASGEAREELTGFFSRADASVWQRDLDGVVHALPSLLSGETRPALIAFAAAAGLLLLIACINVANLLLVRGLGRAREVATRSALGASRRAIAAQLLTENALLAIGGLVLGAALAWVAVTSFVAFAPAGVPRVDEIVVDGRALALAALVTVLSLLVFGLVPALHASRIEFSGILRSGSGQSASRRSRVMMEALVGGQVALAVVILAAAGLIVNSLVRLQRAELAFDPSHLIIGELSLEREQFNSVEKQRALLEDLLIGVRSLQGVRSVSPTVAVPFAGPRGWDGRPASEGQSPEEAARNPMLNMEVVAPDYFTTFGIPILRGRGFADADRDGTGGVVLLSESAARHYWGDDNPIGRKLRMGGNLEQALTVVGIVPDTRYRDLRNARPSVYFPLRQSFFPFVPLTLAIRTTVGGQNVVPGLRRVIRETAPGVDLVAASSFADHLDGPLAQPRLNALLLGMFAVAALVLATVGLYGVMATAVRHRTRELGVRMALGATAGLLRRAVLVRGLAIAIVGTIVGLAGAVLGNRLLEALLYDVTSADLMTLSLVGLVLVSVATLASLISAAAIARIDPVLALRSET